MSWTTKIEDAAECTKNVLSLSTFKRTLKRGRITRKKNERRNINQNPIEGVQFLEAIEHIDPRFFIDADETKQDRESRELKFGYSPEGEECLKDQIIINNVAYSTIAAVTPFGFLAWRIHEGNIDHDELNIYKQRPTNFERIHTRFAMVWILLN